MPSRATLEHRAGCVPSDDRDQRFTSNANTYTGLSAFWRERAGSAAKAMHQEAVAVTGNDLSDGESDLILKALLEDFGRAYGLSRRECEIVMLASTGHRTKEISASLGCATQTVGTYWERIYRKTQNASREMVLALVLRFIVDAMRKANLTERKAAGQDTTNSPP